jgi:peptidoglycan-associated lipoprotein
MRARHVVVSLSAVLLLAACAGNRAANPSLEIIDGPVSSVATPEPAAPEPACVADAECGAGQRCTEGACVAAPTCELLRVAFGFDSAQLDAGAMEALRASAECLAQRRASKLVVEGHADERGTAVYNIALGASRADTVKRYLSGLGVTARIEAVSFGEELPIAPGADERAWAQNRRAELRVDGDTRSDGAVVATH